MVERRTHHRTDVRYDPIIGHIGIPNVTMRRAYSEHPHYIRTNCQGFRSDFDYERVNPTSIPRILFTGDSYAAGDGVSNEDRFSNIACRRLGATPYNFALSGSGVDQQYLIYERLAHHYDHDVLIVSPHIMDIERNISSHRISFEHETGDRYLVPKPYFSLEEGRLVLHNVPVPRRRTLLDPDTLQPYRNGAERISDIAGRLRRASPGKIVSAVRSRVARQHSSSIRHPEYEDGDSAAWQLMRSLLVATIEMAGDVPVLLCPLPYTEADTNPRFSERFIEIADQFSNVRFVDVLARFETANDRADLFAARDGHYSRLGHAVAADALVEVIRDHGLIPPGTASGETRATEAAYVAKKGRDAGYVLGISAFYHDSAAAIVKDGRIISAAQEERFTRLKNDPSFPRRAANYCLEEAGIGVEDLESVVFYDHPYKTLERIIASQLMAVPKGTAIWREMLPKWIRSTLHVPEIIRSELHHEGAIHIAEHHLSHAASAFYPSPFTESAILTIDGVGEWATATIGSGRPDGIGLLKQMNYPDSIGLLYSAFTYYAGFKVNEGEYKLMGLAPYGEPAYVDLIKDHLVDMHDDGSISLNMDYFGFLDSLSMVNQKFRDLFGEPERRRGDRITKRTADVAKSIQTVVEEAIIRMARHARALTGADNLCLAGGVALNCVANGKLLKENIYKDIWIQPASGDAGCALGAALAYCHDFNRIQRSPEQDRQESAYLGPSYSDDEIRGYLDSYEYAYTEVNTANRARAVAELIADGKIVGHYSGRMEFGPRALGARSILGDPRDETAQSVLNLKIKFRESFRPFAPTVLEEDIATYFAIDRPSPYMLLVADVNKNRQIAAGETDGNDIIDIVNQKRSDLPAITHVDYSARIQSIRREAHPAYYDVIREFKEITGYGVVINTSFNVNGEPIVCTPKDAVACFMNTDMDALIMNNFLLIKEAQAFDRKEECRPFPRKRTAVNSRETLELQKECRRLFDRYLRHMDRLDTAHGGHSASSWKECTEGHHWDVMRKEDVLSADVVLRTWGVFSESQKRQLRPLVEEVVLLSNLRKDFSADVGEAPNDAIYAMF